jgi:hypothetical protein
MTEMVLLLGRAPSPDVSTLRVRDVRTVPDIHSTPPLAPLRISYPHLPVQRRSRMSIIDRQRLAAVVLVESMVSNGARS